MLSILIPIYNFEVIQLVGDLHRQALSEGIPFEILCFDDGSTTAFKTRNKKLLDFQHVKYSELPENLGRSKIRNELAKAAKYDYLLFMDGDSKVVSTDYIKNYLKHLDPKTLLYGGRVYDPQAPTDPLLKFHWHYGINREQVAYQIRQKRPYHAFQTNNFLVPKAVFLDILFDESLRQYGHEDTVFGFELKDRNIPLQHIDNPLEHIGLETVEVFLEKTEKGIQNLLRVQDAYPSVETKLLRAYQFLKSTGLKYPFKWGYGFYRKKIEENLRSDQPNLRWFDWYKLDRMLDQ